LGSIRRPAYPEGVASLRRSDVSALLDFLDDVESVSDEGDEIVTETVLTGLAKVVPSDTVWRAECDYEQHSNEMLSSDRRLGPFYEAKQERWWQLREQHPILAHRDLTGDDRAVTLSDLAGRRLLRSLEIYDEFFHPFGVEYSLSIRMRPSLARAVDVGCTRVATDFSHRDRAVLDVLRPSLAYLLRPRGPAAGDGVSTDAGLTRREEEVLRLVSAGLTNAGVAAALFVAPGTVKKHLDHIYEKLEVANRTQAAAWALSKSPSSRSTASSTCADTNRPSAPQS
jgi:DNA-binding CsgD family transcriptional regulator